MGNDFTGADEYRAQALPIWREWELAPGGGRHTVVPRFPEPTAIPLAAEVLIGLRRGFIAGVPRSCQAPSTTRRASCLLERHAHRDAQVRPSLPGQGAILSVVSDAPREP
jgi:hypothetical protein